MSIARPILRPIASPIERAIGGGALAWEGGGGVAWTPQALSPPLFLLADDYVTGTWTNRGTASLTFTEATNPPSKNASDSNFGGAPTLTFDGTNDVLACGSTTALDVGDAESFEAVALLRMTVTATRTLLTSSGETTSGFSLRPRVGGASVFVAWGADTTTLSSARQALTLNTVHQRSWRWAGVATTGSDSMTQVHDGTAQTADSADVHSLAGGGTTWTLGNGAAGRFAGQLAFLFWIKRALTTTERQLFAGWINAKYARALSTV